MKKTMFAIILASAAAVSVQPAMAANTGAGCGIGKAVFDGQSGMLPNIGAWVLNYFIAPQSFSQTSGILGCDTSTQVNNADLKENFVAQNMDSLSIEMAQGQGDHLVTLASIMEISADDRGDFYSMTQDSYGKLFASAQVESSDLLAALATEMSAHPQLNKYVQ